MVAVAALLTLADARLPTGGHAHSGGVEQAVATGVVTDPTSLADFLDRRLHTTALATAALAAAACAAADDAGRLVALDAEADARTPSPASRGAARSQGRGLARLGRRAWPHPGWDALGPAPHHSLALGVAAAAAGLTARDAAQVAAYLTISGPATAATRLLSLDPLTVATVTAGLCGAVDAVADNAAAAASAALAVSTGVAGSAAPARATSFGGSAACPASAATFALPAGSDPLLDLLAENHAHREDRLFAS